MVDDLADHIRAVIGDDPNVGEIRMFGGTCFTLNSNMMVGTMKDGGLLVRVGEDQEAAALALPGASRMNFTGREMKVSSWWRRRSSARKPSRDGLPWRRASSGRCLSKSL